MLIRVSHPDELPGVLTVMFTVVLHVPLALFAVSRNHRFLGLNK